MKKVQLFVMLLLTQLVIHAQILPGMRLGGGQFNLGTSNNILNGNGSKGHFGTVGLSLGKAYKTNKVLGGNVSLYTDQNQFYTNGTMTYSTTNTNFNAGVFNRYYHKLGGKFYGFLQLEAGGNIASTRYKTTQGISYTSQKQYGIYAHLTPGVAYPINPHIQLEVTIPSISSIHYAHIQSMNQSSTITSNNYTVSMQTRLPSFTNLDWLNVGFRVIF